MWLSSVDLTVNARLQISQLYGFSPVCIRICRTRSLGFLKLLLQFSHWWACFPPVSSSSSISLSLTVLMRSFSTADWMRSFSETVMSSSSCAFESCAACSSVIWIIADRVRLCGIFSFSSSVDGKNILSKFAKLEKHCMSLHIMNVYNGMELKTIQDVINIHKR